MRLIHYSAKPLKRVRSIPHHGNKSVSGIYKTPGLWVSVEGEDDWVSWCRQERFGLERIKYATEVTVDMQHILHLSTAEQIDTFSERFGERGGPNYLRGIEWSAVRNLYYGLIIAPYCWERRMSDDCFWYYPWDCASGVIWDKRAVKRLKAIAAPDPKGLEEVGDDQSQNTGGAGQAEQS